MQVLTYYQPLPYGHFAQDPELLELWRERWSALGFSPVVLGPQDLDGEKWSWYSARVATFPTVNPLQYEHACWMRWCAYADWMAKQDPKPELVLAADYDVFNAGMGTKEFWDDLIRCTYYDGQVCSCVRLTAGAVSIMPFVLSALGPHCVGQVYQRQHVSDMFVFQRLASAGWLKQRSTSGYRGQEPVPHRILHLSNDTASQRKTTKLALWRELEAAWPIKTEEPCQP